MFGSSLGFPELVFILVLALLIFGPKRLPEIGRTLGKGLSEFRKATNDLKRTIESEVALEDDRATVRRPAALEAVRRPAATETAVARPAPSFAEASAPPAAEAPAPATAPVETAAAAIGPAPSELDQPIRPA